MDKINICKDIYVDAAASSLKPEQVIAAQTEFLRTSYSNEGRGVCPRASAVDDMVSGARRAAAEFIGAAPEQIVFTGGATDGLNRIPRILDISGAVKPDSVVAVSDLDHHSARLPWEEFAYLNKCMLSVCPLDNDFNIDAQSIPKSDIFAITAMSNVIGTKQNVKELVAAAREKNPNVITIVDAAQYVAHLPIDVKEWNTDFLCFSGHKIGADTGIGVMYIKEPDRWQIDKLGGGMVLNVSPKTEMGANNALSKWTCLPGSDKFEAGTLPLTQILGLKIAMEYKKPKSDLLDYLRAEFSKIPQIKFISPAGASVLTFTVDGMHVLDFGAMMGAKGICLRVGNMCASWMHRAIGADSSIRISTGPWNTMEEMKQILLAAKEIIR
ncbi:MAG: aminotransferase class V-fold PLP-dependent enzyme [Alphaproteobacteria bacterium]|nr:aminotransferase class V-fold PLP-dependent enzyme [Alphaproteobacteria bacterium]